jgi:hypothetical protein
MRLSAVAAALLVSFGLLSACDEELPPPPDLQVDPATLEVTGGDGEPVELIDHRRAEHVYAGAIDDDLFVAVALDDDVATGDPRDVLVYLCDDDEIWLYLGGQMDADGAVAFEVAAGNVRGVDDVTVGEDLDLELMVSEDEVTGELAIAGGEPQAFAALPPEDGTNVGFVMASTAETGTAHPAGWAWAAPRYVGGWIILNPTYRVRGAITLGANIAAIDGLLESTTVPV